MQNSGDNEDVVTGNEGSTFRETKHVFYFSLGFFHLRISA